MAKKQRTLSDERMTELVNDYIAKGKSLAEGEKINVNKFCDEHSIIVPLFYQVFAEAGQRTGQVFPYETTETKSTRPSKDVAIVGKRGNIFIKPQIVAKMNKEKSDEDKFNPDDIFDVQWEEDKIILTKIKK